MTGQNVAIFVPVRVRPDILALTLEALSQVKLSAGRLSFMFYDDNDDEASSALLQEFCKFCGPRSTILASLDLPPIPYVHTHNKHKWTYDLIDRVIRIKNHGLSAFAATSADAVLLLDSDVIIHPESVDHLCSLNLPIVGEVFWTRFGPRAPFMPNAWDRCNVDPVIQRSVESILHLRRPGVYEVGGVGACTLVRRDVLDSGVSFSRIPNVESWGEDLHFCVRASCQGFRLHVDTRYPAYHVYRPEQVGDAQTWLRRGCPQQHFGAWLNDDWERAVRRRENLEGLSARRRFGLRLVRAGMARLRRIESWLRR